MSKTRDHWVKERAMNDHLRRALEALQTGASELRSMSAASPAQVRARLQTTAEEVLQHLEAEADGPEDMMQSLDRRSREIAEDLRRVDRLMNERLGRTSNGHE